VTPEIEGAITQAAQEAGVDPAFALAVADRESSGDPSAHASKSMFGLFQMSGGLRQQYGSGNSTDPYTQAKAWTGFINDTRNQMAARLGRDPTNAELYLGHYFGEGRAASMIAGQGGGDVRDVFTPQELAENPEIARAGGTGRLMASITGDINQREAKYGGESPGAPIDFTKFGQPEEGGGPIDFAKFGAAADEYPGLQSGTPVPGGGGAQAAGGGNSMTGLSSMLSQMAPNGVDTSGMRPSTNVEDARGESTLEKLKDNFIGNVTGKYPNPTTGELETPTPATPGSDVDLSQFGLTMPAAPNQEAQPSASGIQ
jgi:hypothetical protein